MEGSRPTKRKGDEQNSHIWQNSKLVTHLDRTPDSGGVDGGDGVGDSGGGGDGRGEERK
jgi:hypothetical protein